VRHLVDLAVPKRYPVRLVYALRSCLRVVLTYRCNIACKYCYTRGLEADYPRDMDLEDLKGVLAWARRDGKTSIRLLGGEPTLHPGFSEVVRLCREYGFHVSFATNNTFGDTVLRALEPDVLDEVCVNINAWDVLDAPGRARFETNLSDLGRRGLNFRFSCVVEDDASRDLLALARKWSPDHVRLSLPLPGPDIPGEEKEALEEMGGRVSSALLILERLAELGIPGYVYRPVPACLIGEGEERRLSHMGRHLVYKRCCMGYGGDFSLMIVVNPDLSVLPCASLLVRGPELVTFRNSREVSDHFREELIRRFSAPPLAKCAACDSYRSFTSGLGRKRRRGFFDPALCQGGCLCFRE